MADQKTLKGPGASGHHEGNGGVVSGIADLGNDIATLVELQAKLAALDLRASSERLLWPVVVVVAAVLLAVSSIPVILLGIADLLSRALNINPGWGMLLTAVASLIVAAILITLFYKRIVQSFEPLRRSREEMTRNLAWIRTVLVHSGRAFTGRRL
ncbi:MAG: hypothetical protein NVSMB9_06950 [Isosphaeraceae bacterium]